MLMGAIFRWGMAAETTTNAILNTVVAGLQPVLQGLDPKPSVEFPDYTTSLRVTYLPQKYMIHGRSKTGEVSTNAHEEIGPSFSGFVFWAQLQPKGTVNQTDTPQTIREPYWLMDLDITTIGQTDNQIYWVLSYAGRTPTNLLAEIKKALKLMERSPNQAPKDTAHTLADPQR